MAAGGADGGFTLVETVVAVLLLSVTATAVARVCVQGQRARRLSENSMRATLLAAGALERLRAAPGIPAADCGEAVCATTEQPWSGRPDLKRTEVTVTWNDGRIHTLRLHTLLRR